MKQNNVEMKWMADIDIPEPAEKINYDHTVFLSGSCFTEHIGGRLEDHKFTMLQNPNGILFDPLSVCNSLQSYLHPRIYNEGDLVYLNELWQSWQHHTRYSGTDKASVVNNINQSQNQAHAFLKKADWLIITLGSAFSYQLQEGNRPIANCHRAPAKWFHKMLLSIETIEQMLSETLKQLRVFNPALKVIFTISPVRHLRDGVIDNNRSKARLIESVHNLVQSFDRCYYFPAYELVIDVLRDYRFYDIDLAHPNYAATDFVFEKFRQHYIDPTARQHMDEIKKLMNAFRHRPFHPSIEAHKVFLRQSLSKALQLQQQLPQLDFSEQINYFKAAV